MPATPPTPDSRLSIALLCESFDALGGVAQIVEELAGAFARAGHRVAIVSNTHPQTMTRPHNPAVEQIRVDLPRTKPFTLRHPERLWRRRRAADLAAFFRQWSPDLVNIHGGLRDRFPPVLAACRRTGVPFVQSFHLVPEPCPQTAEAARLNRFSRRTLSAARAITFPSTAVKQGFRKISPCAEHARIIRGGVNFERAVCAIPVSRPRPYVFSASRFDLRHKAVDELIASFRLLAEEFPEVDLLIAGDGPDRRRIAELINASQLDMRIHLLSALPHDELWSLYKGALVFVMLSRMKEGLPLVFFEAMACGVPVIGTMTGGTPEIVTDGETGFLLEHNEPPMVAAALRTLLTDPARRGTMGQRGRELAKGYDWQAVAALYIELYQNLVS